MAQPLVWSLEQLRDFGPKAFYEGEIAKKIVKEMERNSLISMEDLKQYKPLEREPVEGTFRDFKIVSMPPASSGIHLIGLNTFEEFPSGIGFQNYIYIFVSYIQKLLK